MSNGPVSVTSAAFAVVASKTCGSQSLFGDIGEQIAPLPFSTLGSVNEGGRGGGFLAGSRICVDLDFELLDQRTIDSPWGMQLQLLPHARHHLL